MTRAWARCTVAGPRRVSHSEHCCELAIDALRVVAAVVALGSSWRAAVICRGNASISTPPSSRRRRCNRLGLPARGSSAVIAAGSGCPYCGSPVLDIIEVSVIGLLGVLDRHRLAVTKPSTIPRRAPARSPARPADRIHHSPCRSACSARFLACLRFHPDGSRDRSNFAPRPSTLTTTRSHDCRTRSRTFRLQPGVRRTLLATRQAASQTP